MIQSYDPLTQALLDREGEPKEHATTPPAEKRYSTAQSMMTAYQQGWNPNPIYLRLTQGSHATNQS